MYVSSNFLNTNRDDTPETTMIGPELSFTPRGLYIGGEWQEAANGGRLASINPSTGEHLGEVPAATPADVDRAVHAARMSFESEWGRMPMRERAGYLERLADRLHEHRDELGLMDCVDAGNALAGMVGDVDWTVDTLRYFAGLVTEIKGETSSYGPRHLNFTRRQPYGWWPRSTPSTIRSASAPRRPRRRWRRGIRWW